MKNESQKLKWVTRSGCIWALGGSLFGTLGLLVLVVLGIFTRVSSFANPSANPVLTILPWSTVDIATNTGEPPNQTDVPTPSPTQPPSPEGSFENGQLVTVTGTGGDGLRLRNQPSLDGSISFLAFENELFQVLDGPILVDGYLWWYLINPYDESKSGWAVVNYLRSIDTP